MSMGNPRVVAREGGGVGLLSPRDGKAPQPRTTPARQKPEPPG